METSESAWIVVSLPCLILLVRPTHTELLLSPLSLASWGLLGENHKEVVSTDALTYQLVWRLILIQTSLLSTCLRKLYSATVANNCEVCHQWLLIIKYNAYECFCLFFVNWSRFSAIWIKTSLIPFSYHFSFWWFLLCFNLFF